MKVLTVFAHHGSHSFCHSLLDRFDAGLRQAGHVNEIVDLHAINFDPVLRGRDDANWLDPNAPEEILAGMHVPQRLLEGAGGPLRRLAVRRWLRGRAPRDVVRALRERYRPSDVAIQQEKVKAAQALVFIAPVYFLGFPAILKGWIERVFTLGFAFALTPAAWRGDIRGRIPLLTHEKALVLQTTIFDQSAYDDGLRDAMRVVMDEFALRYPGIKRVQHEYFYAVHDADAAKLNRYLDRALQLGREF